MNEKNKLELFIDKNLKTANDILYLNMANDLKKKILINSVEIITFGYFSINFCSFTAGNYINEAEKDNGFITRENVKFMNLYIDYALKMIKEGKLNNRFILDILSVIKMLKGRILDTGVIDEYDVSTQNVLDLHIAVDNLLDYKDSRCFLKTKLSFLFYYFYLSHIVRAIDEKRAQLIFSTDDALSVGNCIAALSHFPNVKCNIETFNSKEYLNMNSLYINSREWDLIEDEKEILVVSITKK